MKKLVTASSDYDTKARRILRKCQDLLDELDDTPEGFLEVEDLHPLYSELFEVIPALNFSINSGNAGRSDYSDLYDE